MAIKGHSRPLLSHGLPCYCETKFLHPKKPWFLMIPLEIPTNLLVSILASFRGSKWISRLATAFRSEEPAGRRVINSGVMETLDMGMPLPQLRGSSRLRPTAGIERSSPGKEKKSTTHEVLQGEKSQTDGRKSIFSKQSRFSFLQCSL